MFSESTIVFIITAAALGYKSYTIQVRLFIVIKWVRLRHKMYWGSAIQVGSSTPALRSKPQVQMLQAEVGTTWFEPGFLFWILCLYGFHVCSFKTFKNLIQKVEASCEDDVLMIVLTDFEGISFSQI